MVTEGLETVEVEIIEEIKSKSIKPNRDMKELEQEFTSFINSMEAANAEAGNTIKIEELGEIKDEVIKAQRYLQSFSNGEKKSSREQAYSHLTNIPLIGSWAKSKVEDAQEQRIKETGVEEVVKDMYSSFERKKARLIELTILTETMRNNLISQEFQLQTYIRELDNIIENPKSAADKMMALDMSIRARSQDAITKEMVYNQLNFILEGMEALMVKISKNLPILKATLNNSLKITGVINSMKDSLDMMNVFEEFTNEIVRTSTNNIQNLIIDSTKALSSGTDVEFYKEGQKRNEEFNKTLLDARKKHIGTVINNYNTLKAIEIDTSNQLENRRKEEALALGMNIDTMKESIETTETVKFTGSQRGV